VPPPQSPRFSRAQRPSLTPALLTADGKHVTDDYYEAPARAKCAEEGIEPGSLLGELPDPASLVESRNLNLSQAAMASHRVPANQPFYTPGGPTTHFPSNGLDPFTEAKGFAKRLTLTKAGFSQDNWLARFASEASEKNSEMGRQRRERLEEIRQGFMWDGVEAPAPVPFAALGAIAVAAKTEPVAGGGDEQLPSAVASLKGKEREPSVASTALTPTTGGFPSRAQSVQPTPVLASGAFDGGFPGPDPATRPVKRVRRVGAPLGVYEPETHIPQGAFRDESAVSPREMSTDSSLGLISAVHMTTQPTTATFERIAATPSFAPFDPSLAARNPDPAATHAAPFGHLSAMGGNRIGADSWALASVRYEMDVADAAVRDKGVVLGHQ
jgi:hypothetical protein